MSDEPESPAAIDVDEPLELFCDSPASAEKSRKRRERAESRRTNA